MGFHVAGWRHVDWVGGQFVFTKNNWPGNHVYGEMGVTNISLELFEEAERLRPAAEALATALREVGIAANVAGPNNPSSNRNVIHLLVGQKQGAPPAAGQL
jgi:hypothetical protein